MFRIRTVRWTFPLVVAAAVLLLLATVACQPQSPEERIEALRADYTVQLNSFTVDQTPLEEPDPAMAEDEGGAEDAAEDADAEGADGEGADGAEGEDLAEEVPVATDVVLDILVGTKGQETLDGLTVEVEQVDSAGNVKDRRLLWLDTSNVLRGQGSQMAVVLEDVDYADGDAFAVTLVSPVPAAERSEYREFDTAP